MLLSKRTTRTTLLCLVVTLAIATIVQAANVITEIEQAAPNPCEPEDLTKLGDVLHIFYTGSIALNSAAGEPGYIFDDTTHRRGRAVRFTLGSEEVIRGWDEGLVGMCLGEVRGLNVPPELGFVNGQPDLNIPPGATLFYRVHLVQVNERRGSLPSKHSEMGHDFFAEMDVNSDGYLTVGEMENWFRTMHPDNYDGIPRGLFEREDKNKDGLVSWEEFDGPKGRAPAHLAKA